MKTHDPAIALSETWARLKRALSKETSRLSSLISRTPRKATSPATAGSKTKPAPRTSRSRPRYTPRPEGTGIRPAAETRRTQAIKSTTEPLFRPVSRRPAKGRRGPRSLPRPETVSRTVFQDHESGRVACLIQPRSTPRLLLRSPSRSPFERVEGLYPTPPTRQGKPSRPRERVTTAPATLLTGRATIDA